MECEHDYANMYNHTPIPVSRLATSFDSAVKPQPLSRQAGLEQCGLVNHATTRQVDEIKTFFQEYKCGLESNTKSQPRCSKTTPN